MLFKCTKQIQAETFYNYKKILHNKIETNLFSYNFSNTIKRFLYLGQGFQLGTSFRLQNKGTYVFIDKGNDASNRKTVAKNIGLQRQTKPQKVVEMLKTGMCM